MSLKNIENPRLTDLKSKHVLIRKKVTNIDKVLRLSDQKKINLRGHIRINKQSKRALVFPASINLLFLNSGPVITARPKPQQKTQDKSFYRDKTGVATVVFTDDRNLASLFGNIKWESKDGRRKLESNSPEAV